jgi:hypothetical protein
MLATEEGATMSTRSNVLRLAVFGLLLARAPRGVQRVVGYMALGVVFAVALIILSVTARSAQAADNNNWKVECRRGWVERTVKREPQADPAIRNDPVFLATEEELHPGEVEFRIEFYGSDDVEEVEDLQNALHNLKICFKFWRCVRERNGEEPPRGKRPARCPESMLDRGWRGDHLKRDVFP